MPGTEAGADHSGAFERPRAVLSHTIEFAAIIREMMDWQNREGTKSSRSSPWKLLSSCV